MSAVNQTQSRAPEPVCCTTLEPSKKRGINERFERIVGTVFRNHQNYTITFKKMNHEVVCDMEKDGHIKSNISLVATSSTSTEQRLNSPFSITYYPDPNILVLGSYGLQGGLEDNSKSDNEKENPKESADAAAKEDAYFKLQVANKVTKVVIGIVGIAIIIFFPQHANKFIGIFGKK